MPVLKTRRVAVTLAAVAAAVLVAAGCGGSVAATPTVPDACLTALDLADEGFDQDSQALGIASGMLDDVFAQDYDALDLKTAKLNSLTDRVDVNADDYTAARDQCRTAAER